MMTDIDLAIIGGTGLYDIDGLQVEEMILPSTPFGRPSDEIALGTFQGRNIAFLPRHGKGHRLLPSEIPFQANIYALRMLGAKRLISISAVGALSDGLAPMDIVFPDQLVDRTKGRASTFFGQGIVAHVAFSHPICPDLTAVALKAARDVAPHVKSGGTYLCMEGPAFSTRAESVLHKSWGMDVVGMTALPEAKLAREAEMCYCLISLVTDYDAWHETEEPVTAEMILGYLHKNAENAKRIIATIIAQLPTERNCSCGRTLEQALVTDLTRAPVDAVERLRPLLAQYL
jgi:5'-methylthioadenosine phosphorylase